MADSVITEPNGAAITLTGYQRIISKLTKQSKGLAAVSFDSYADGATAPSVVAGGIYEINGTYYEVDSDTQITGMSSASTTYYIYSTSGTWSSSTTAPAWDEARQGWYLSTDANARCFFTVITDSGGNYDERGLLPDMTYVDVSNLRFVGGFNFTRNVKTLLKSSAFQENEIYDFFDAALPNVGDAIQVSGCLVKTGTTTTTYTLSYAYRSDASTISYWALISTAGTTNNASLLAFTDTTTSWEEANLCIVY